MVDIDAEQLWRTWSCQPQRWCGDEIVDGLSYFQVDGCRCNYVKVVSICFEKDGIHLKRALIWRCLVEDNWELFETKTSGRQTEDCCLMITEICLKIIWRLLDEDSWQRFSMKIAWQRCSMKIFDKDAWQGSSWWLLKCFCLIVDHCLRI